MTYPHAATMIYTPHDRFDDDAYQIELDMVYAADGLADASEYWAQLAGFMFGVQCTHATPFCSCWDVSGLDGAGWGWA